MYCDTDIQMMIQYKVRLGGCGGKVERKRGAMSSKTKTVLGLLLFGGTMFALPYGLRAMNTHTNEKERLTGSQRQRGMYMNAGSSDGGKDPDWDPVTSTWKGKRYSGKSGTSSG